MHLGINFSLKKWKKNQWQRSDDFFNNFVRIINRSCENDIDFLLIAGDIYNRSQPNPAVTHEVLKQFMRLSNYKPVIIIPGNHDRSKLSIGLLYLKKNIHIFNKPKNLLIKIKGKNVLITGIPFIGNKSTKFFEENNKYLNFRATSIEKTHIRILMLHELVESSKFGIHNFEFKKTMKGVIPLNLISDSFNYVALGHIHTYQKIKHKSKMIYYSGSIERTSVVERYEEKGFIIIEVNFQNNIYLNKILVKFCRLPSRPLIFYKLRDISEFDINKFELDLMKIKKKYKLKSLVILRTKYSSNYQDYSSIKLYFTKLIKKKIIRNFSIFSEDFRLNKAVPNEVLIDPTLVR